MSRIDLPQFLDSYSYYLHQIVEAVSQDKRNRYEDLKINIYIYLPLYLRFMDV